MRAIHGLCVMLGLAFVALPCLGADWGRFRGPDGMGLAVGAAPPDRWSATENVVWKTALPGAGASSPIVVGDRVFVTCYSDYGLDPDEPGDVEKLKRHLVGIALADGKVLWDQAVPAKLPEQTFEGFVALHGYASPTPASDGTAIYVFFGRSGVYAYGLDGTLLWQADVGSRTHAWGSAASPLVWEGLVFVNASIESGAIIALDNKTGKEAWRVGGIQQSWSTPALASLPGGRTELVVSSYGRVRGLDPSSGEVLWECRGVNDYVCPAVVAHEGIVYVTAGRKPHTLAIRAGGKGDVSKTHVLWENNETPKVATPLVYDGHLYWVDNRGVATCVDGKTGKTVYKERLAVRGQGDKVYASPVLAGGKLFVPSRQDGTIVLVAGPEFREIGRSRLDDSSVFNATAAVVDDRLLVRSNRFLYCLGK